MEWCCNLIWGKACTSATNQRVRFVTILRVYKALELLLIIMTANLSASSTQSRSQPQLKLSSIVANSGHPEEALCTSHVGEKIGLKWGETGFENLIITLPSILH